MPNEYIALAEQSAENDLAFLLKAKEEWKKRMKENPTPENINGFNKARDSVEAEVSRLSISPQSRVYKTQLDAVAYLKDAGFKVSKSQFNRDVKARKMPMTADGCFDESALMGYAASYLSPTGQLTDKAMSTATTERLSADAELKKYQAERQKLKLEKEQGKLMPIAEYERNLAARALFFKKEVENFIFLHGAGIIHLVGGKEEMLPAFEEHWEKITAHWMDTWSKERDFMVDDTTESEEQEEA